MSKNIKIFLAIVGFGLITGCTPYINATVFPHGKSSYTVVALSNSENHATKNAMAKATEVCQATGKEVNVTKQNAVYQGIDKSQKAVAGFAGDVLNVIAKGNASSHEEEGGNDYKVTLDFVCV
jgi:hypothetical protein